MGPRGERLGELRAGFERTLDFRGNQGRGLAATREAIAGYIEAAEKEGIPLPGPTEVIELEVAVG